MSRYVAKAMYLGKPKRIVFRTEGVAVTWFMNMIV